ncbi:hypothetical protein K8Q98_00380 [Candidatus Nomurabacteria bacterium]|nr:hypothetical protein [Candidatus Nomurabacteria bacterium]
MVTRILACILLLWSVFFMPIWLSILLLILGMLYFSLFFEGVIIFLLSDFLYGAERVGFTNTIFISSIVALIILLLVEFGKKKLKFYPVAKNK